VVEVCLQEIGHSLLGSDRRHDGFAPWRVAAGNEDASTPASERKRGRFADAARRTRYEGRATAEVQMAAVVIHVLPKGIGVTNPI
jgi:hypothetical protein